MPFKALCAALSIGGVQEDPSIQIGSNLGLVFGQRLNLSDESTRLLVSAGAASVLLASIFFALARPLLQEF